MTYSEAVQFLFDQRPSQKQIGYQTDLSRITELCKIFKNPQNNFKSIHIAGTNGKGSTTHLLASVLQEAGYKVGIFCSPHLVDFSERIKINGQPIPEQEVINFVKEYQELLSKPNSSQFVFFEYITALAFNYFAQEKVNIAIIETGIGGRLDATNIITPELSIITSIGFDHTDILGNSIEQIATEKAGIVKKGIPLIIGEYSDKTHPIFLTKTKSSQSQLIYTEPTNFSSDLKGEYQSKNIATAYAALQVLQKLNWKINQQNIIDGFQNVVKNTNFQGRWQKIQDSPTVILDTGHNPHAVQHINTELQKFIQKNPTANLHIIWGCVNDKDPHVIFQILPKQAIYYFASPYTQRAILASDLQKIAQSHGLHGKAYDTVIDAYNFALKQASAIDLILVGGSNFVVGEVLRKIQGIE